MGVAVSAPTASRWREVRDSAEKVRIAGRFPFGSMRATIGTCSSALVATGTLQCVGELPLIEREEAAGGA